MYGFYCLTSENYPHPIIVAFDTSRDEFLEIEVRNEEGVISYEEKRAMSINALLDSPEKLDEYNANEKLVNSFVSTCRSEDEEDMFERFLGLPSFQLLSVKDWNIGREMEIYPISLAISPMDRFFDRI